MDKKQEAIRLDSYKLKVNDIVVSVNIILEKDGFVPLYNISLLNISKITDIILRHSSKDAAFFL